MTVALKEILRQPRRYFPVWFALTLLVVLLVILGGFLDGLSRSQTGPYRAYDGDVWVFDDQAGLQLQRSQLDGNVLDTNTVDGVDRVGTIDAAFTVSAIDDSTDSQSASTDEAESDADLYDIVLYGYSLDNDLLPEPPADGEVVVDKQLQRLTGVDTGDVLLIGPAEEPMTITTIVDDVSNGAPTVWSNPDEWARLVTTINPAAVPPNGTHQALIARPTEGVSPSQLAQNIGEVDGLEGATVDKAIGALAVVQQQSNTFTGIIVVTFVVSLLVVALFFALITLEQARLYAVLKALGARTGELLRGVSIQAVVVTMLALIVGIAISALIVLIIPPNLPIRVLPLRVVQISVGLLITALLGGLLTARRILRIDPATAIG